MKNYPTSVKNAIAENKPETTLFEFQLVQGTFFLTTAVHDIEYGFNSYIASGLILANEDVKQQSELRVNSLKLRFSGVDQTFTALFQNANQQNRKVLITHVILNNEHQVIGPLLTSRYLINDYGYDDNEQEATLDVNLTNYLSNFNAVAGIRTTQESFRRFYPNSTFFINSKDTGAEFKWGGK